MEEPAWFTKACERFAKTGSCREDAAEEDSVGWEVTQNRRKREARRRKLQEEKWRKDRMEARRRDRLRSRVGYGAELTMEQAMERRVAEAQEQERRSTQIDACREWKVYGKENNMVVKKNSKKKTEVAKEENGERLIK